MVALAFLLWARPSSSSLTRLSDMHQNLVVRVASVQETTISDAEDNGEFASTTRRVFLLATGVAVLSSYLVACGGATGGDSSEGPGLDRFMVVSSILTGYGAALPSTPAPAYLKALSALGLECGPEAFLRAAYSSGTAPSGMDDLRRSGATSLPGADEFMRRLNEAWWTGFAPEPGGAQAFVTLDDALCFKVTYAPTRCMAQPSGWALPA